MEAVITAGRARGSVTVPPSKSYAHRLLICAALAGAGSTVHGISESEDMLATLDCIRALGGEVERSGSDISVLRGMGGGEMPVCRCRESGSTLRFFIPLALALRGGAVFCGTQRLIERGVGIYEQLLGAKGISFDKCADSITVSGELRPGKFTVRGDVSSQFISGLLFALPLLDGDSIIEVLPPVESRAYIDITVQTLRDSGISIEEREKNVFYVPGNIRCRPRECTVEGDWSNAAFLYALNECGGEVKPEGLKQDSIQGDKVCLELFEKLREPGACADISACPDLGPVLFAMAARGCGGSFTGTRRLRIKESDRAQAMADELKKFSVEVRVDENEVVIPGGGIKAPTEKLDGHNDHRIVMALSVLCTETGGTVTGAQAVSKSYPDFFEALGALGVETELHDK